MTKQTKIILGVVGGLLLIGGFVVVAIAAVIGLSVMAAQDDTKETKPAVKRDKNGNPKQQKKAVDEGNEKEEKPQKPDDESDEESSKTEAASLNGTLAPELVGKWMWSEGSRQDDGTGKTKYGGGSWHTYEFAAGGAVKYTMKKDLLTIMQCRINETKSGEGEAVSDGDMLTISFGEMQDTGTNSCGGENNFDKTIPAETIKLKYELKTEYGETQLCITGEEGERCYQKSLD